MMAIQLKPFDPADYLTDEESISEYLKLALESNDPRDIVQSLADVTRARGGIGPLAQETGIESDVLRQVLSDTGNPDLKTLVKILDAFGVKLSLSNGVSESVAA